MNPIEFIANFITYNLLGIVQNSSLGNTINFIIYDLIFISILLSIMVFVVSYLRTYISAKNINKKMQGKKGILYHFFASCLGVISPFCSCSSIPLFVGFLSASIPLGVTFAFLISSPLVNEASLYLFPAIFGWQSTLLYNLVGIIISVLGGMLIEKLKMEKYVQPEFLKFKSKKQIEADYQNKKVPFKDLIKHWSSEALEISKQVYPYVLLGVGLGALIHGYVPEFLITKYLSIKDWWVIPLATLMGVPLYANSVSVIPIVEALIEKGIPMGSVLSFMTATVTLSLPEALMLKKLMKWPLLLTFFGITIIGIMIIGYLFNILN